MSELVSVIIPVHNDSYRLKKCLTALKYQDYRNYEVLLIDNNSKENIKKICKEYSFVKYFKEEKKGSYSARNKGISNSNGEIIAFTDSDCIPNKDWLSEGVKAFKKNIS
ncbi:MAG: glycosyltransferase family A protein, partial [Candidatus Woesearchaeota archaeon]